VLLLETVSGMAVVVLFLTVKVFAALVVPCVTLPNAREAGVTVIGETPVPLKASVTGLPVPAKVTVMLPVWAAAAVGANVALMVQVEEAGTEAPQVLVSAKGAAVVIVRAIAVVSLFLTVNVEAALVVPSPTEPKLWDVGVTVIGATPVAVTVADTGLPTPV
jgi:hypothetical protein